MGEIYCVCTIRRGRQIILEQFNTQEEAEARAAIISQRRYIETFVSKMTTPGQKQIGGKR